MLMKNLTWLICLSTAGSIHAQSLPLSPAAEGKKVFQASCAVGYCHGADGRAGKGPRLRDRVWSKSYLYKTIEQGIPGSSMPGWQGRLPEEKIAAVISYIFTISQEDTAPVSKIEPGAAGQPAVKTEMPGKALFFDLMRDRNCGVCHRVSDAGSEIAPRFTSLRGMSAQSLLNQILSQPVSKNNIQLHLEDGEEFCGVEAGEDHNSVRIYDLGGAGPPVSRTIERNAVLNSKPCPSLNVHADNSRIYSSGELMSIVEFLR